MGVLRENRATVITGALVAVLLAALWLILRPSPSAGTTYVALVHDGDGSAHELPLDRDARLTVCTSLGTNVISVQDGAVSVADADCPARTCVAAQPISAPGAQIICLPHQLWIEVVPQGSEGGQMDISLAERMDDVDLVAQ